jgi:integrase
MLRGDARLALVLALGCGLRWGEIISLTWENVLPGGVRVLASLAKGRRQRVVPISKELSGLLQGGRSAREGSVITGDVWDVHEKVCRWLRRKGVKDSSRFITCGSVTGVWRWQITGFLLRRNSWGIRALT